MKKYVVAVAVVVFMLSLITSGYAAEVVKIGVFDFQKIITESSAGKLIQQQINDKGNELQDKLKAEKEKLDELSKAYEREKLVLSPDKQSEKEKEFRTQINDFKKMQDDFTREFKQLEIEKLNQLQEEIFAITTEMGNSEGYSVILEKKAGGVVFSQEKLDITDQIIKKYNLKTSKSN